MPCVVSISVRGATGGTCPAVRSVKHEEKQSCINQKLNWWPEAWFSPLSQKKRIAHLLFPQIFVSAEPKRVDIISAKLPPTVFHSFPSVSLTYPNNVSLQCFFWRCNRWLTWYEVWRQNVCNVAIRSCLQMSWEFVQVWLYSTALCL
jgi:hypothetical protein